MLKHVELDATKPLAAPFGPLRGVYPSSATAHPHLFRRVHVPLICVGEG